MGRNIKAIDVSLNCIKSLSVRFVSRLHLVSLCRNGIIGHKLWHLKGRKKHTGHYNVTNFYRNIQCHVNSVHMKLNKPSEKLGGYVSADSVLILALCTEGYWTWQSIKTLKISHHTTGADFNINHLGFSLLIFCGLQKTKELFFFMVFCVKSRR